MDQTTLAVLVIGGIIAFYIGLRVLASLTSRGIDKAFAAGRKAVSTQRDAEIDEAVAVPLVLTSTASAADIMTSIDAIVRAKKTAPGLKGTVYESGRTADTITFARGNQFYPQMYVVEVHFGQRDGATQVIVKTLHLAVNKDGVRFAADELMTLRQSIELAVRATGDPEKMAAGLRLYGPPEPGSPRAKDNTVNSALAWVGGGLCIYTLFRFRTGFYVSDLPAHLGVLAAGVALVSIAQWRERRGLAARKVEQMAILSGASVTATTAGSVTPAGATGAADPATGAAAVASDVVTKLASAANSGVAAASRLSPKQRIIAGVALLAVLAVGGYAISSASRSADTPAGWSDVMSEEDQASGSDVAATEALPDEEYPVDAGSVSEPSAAHLAQAPDVMDSAPADGSAVTRTITFDRENSSADGAVAFTIEGVEIGAPIQLWSEEVDAFYVGEDAASWKEFTEQVAFGIFHRGTLTYSNERISEIRVTVE